MPAVVCLDYEEYRTGRTIPCISLEGQKVFHSGYDPKEKDLHDIKILEQITKETRGMNALTIAQIMEIMISFSEGNIHDIDHLIRVWTYAKPIGELEGLDANTQYILEVSAITHDIACPLCREKYGNTNGKYQEEEGAPMVKKFLSDCGMRI